MPQMIIWTHDYTWGLWASLDDATFPVVRLMGLGCRDSGDNVWSKEEAKYGYESLPWVG